MVCRAGLTLLLVAAACPGCGEQATPSPDAGAAPPAALTAATLGEQTLMTTSEYLAEPPWSGADRANGESQARICRACHSLAEGGPHMVGPNLHGFFGRPAGSVPGFDYSNALAEADFTWTPRALDAWLQQPARFLPGNRMVVAGVGNASDRADLIAYLLESTGQ